MINLGQLFGNEDVYSPLHIHVTLHFPSSLHSVLPLFPSLVLKRDIFLLDAINLGSYYSEVLLNLYL